MRVARSQDFTSPFVDRTGVQDTAFEVSGLEESTRYYWQAGASGPAGLGPWSDVWSFTTAKAAASVGASELGSGVGLALAQNRPDPFTGNHDLLPRAAGQLGLAAVVPPAGAVGRVAGGRGFRSG